MDLGDPKLAFSAECGESDHVEDIQSSELSDFSGSADKNNKAEEGKNNVQEDDAVIAFNEELENNL